MARLSAAEIRGLQAKRKAALKKKKQTKQTKQERTKVMVTKEQDKFPAVEPTGAKVAAKAPPNIGQPTMCKPS